MTALLKWVNFWQSLIRKKLLTFAVKKLQNDIHHNKVSAPVSFTKRLDKHRWSLKLCATFKNHFIVKIVKLTSEEKKLYKTVWFQKNLWTNSTDVISVNCLDCRRPDASAFYPSQEAVIYADPSSSSPLSISFIVYIITPIQSRFLPLVQKIFPEILVRS